MDFNTLFDEYRKLIQLKGYKTGGGAQYIQAIREFFHFLKQRGYAEFHVTGEDMTSYYEYLISRPCENREGTLSQTTINHHLFGIRILFDYVLETGIKDALPLLPKYLRNKEEPKGILSVDEVKLMYCAVESKLERAILSTAYGCGLRRKEMEGLQLSDVYLKSGMIIVRKGKGSKRREVPLSDMVIKDLSDYIYEERRIRHSPLHRLFVTPRGSAMSGYFMNELVKGIKNRVPELQAKEVTLHTLRRSIGTHLIENGASIHFIRSFLGHSMIDTTQLYTIRRKRQTKIA